MHTIVSRRSFIAGLGTACLPAAGARIRVGCQTNAFPLKPGDFAQLLDALQSLKRLGYEGFECNCRFVQDQFSRAPEARKQIQATGVKFIGAHTNLKEMLGARGPEIATGVAALGAECIVMSASGLSAEGQFTKAALLEKVRQIETVARLVKAHGLLLAYHNHSPEFANQNAEINGLAENSDPSLVHFLMDAGHGYLGGGDPAAFIERHSRRVYGIHLKTFRGKQVSGQVPLGEGDFGFEALAAAVRKTHWTGWLIVEEGGVSPTDRRAALGPDRAYIRRVFGV